MVLTTSYLQNDIGSKEAQLVEALDWRSKGIT